MVRVEDKSDSEVALMKLGDAIRATRLRRKLSQEALADAAGINRTHMGEVERGKRNVSFLALLRIARAMDVEVSEMASLAGL